MTKHLTALTRRSFLKAAGTTFTGLMIVPRHVVAGSGQTPPSQRVNLAAIGIGGRGFDDLEGLAPGNNVVALCDVDWTYAAKTLEKHPGAKQFTDYRLLFDKLGREVDAVVIATPDHTHAVIAMEALRRGKHVYLEKPLAHSIHELRELSQAARRHKVVTQMGNQGHSFGSTRDFCEWIWDGAIGQVHTIHAGLPFSNNSGLDDLPGIGRQVPVPPGLNWDLWLGPAQFRPYNPAYLPGKWRGWIPFGGGTIGDWTCHVVDPVFWALDLGAPLTVQAEVKNWDPKTQGDVFPKGEAVTYEFPGTAKRGAITMKWFTGTEKVPRPPELKSDEDARGIAAAVYGDKGTIVYGGHGAGGVRLIPDEKMEAYRRPARTLPRVKDHYADWLNAIRTGTKAGADFEYGAALTEVALLGVIAIRLAGTKLAWDEKRTRFTNCREADLMVNPPYRKGWKL
jgi:predicted dehydrogenase